MKILLDTQVWLWLHLAPDRLAEGARALLEDEDNRLFLSAASAWEIAIKHALGKLSLPELPERYIPPRLLRDSIESLPVSIQHACRVATLPPYHRDPFDRVLVAQAQVEALPLMTADSQLAPYDVELLAAG